MTAAHAITEGRASSLQARLIAYRDQLGNAESKALIADALDELSRRTWRESLMLEALKPFAAASEHLHPANPDDGVTLDGIKVRHWRAAWSAVATAEAANPAS